jgi:centromere protein K
MNHAYASLDDPYIELEPGTYYSPYIQTLLKGGIIKYHPEDSRRVRLNDFNS